MSILLGLCIVLSFFSTTVMASSFNATPTKASVYINGSLVPFEAYTINGSNYFKMRDIAMALNNTNKQFNIGYNNATNTIEVTLGQPYVPVGGELQQGDGMPKAATPGNATIQWVTPVNYAGISHLKYNIALGTYVIGGNNFVKLRDLMQWLDVGVGYDSKTSAISIVTSQSYVLPKYSGNPLASAQVIANKYRKDYGAEPGSIQNEGEIVYDNGWYYHYGFKIQEGGQAVAYKQDYGDYITYNWQVYGDKIFFEGDHSASVTSQRVFSMNLDGSGLKTIISNSLETGRSITVYKGKLYANACLSSNQANTSIVSYNLDGTGRKVLYTGNLAYLPRNLSYGHRAYFVSNDRIYFMTKDREIRSMGLNGEDNILIKKVPSNTLWLINVYDGYIYYEIRGEGLHRMKVDGTENICVLPYTLSNSGADQFAIYGDKIIYNVGPSVVGVVNTDGTGRYQFPNAKQDPERTTVTYVSTLMVLNNKYTFAQNVLLNNDSAVPGHIRLGANYSDPNDNDIRGQRGWFPTKVPQMNTITDLVSSGSNSVAGKLANGWYNLRAMNNYLYLDAQGGAQLRTTDKKQKFLVEHKNGNYFTIKTEDGKYLGISQAVANGVQVKAVDQEHLWSLRSENNKDIFSMRPANNGEMLLNASGEKNTDGTWIILWKHTNADAPNHAEFRFIPVQ